MFGALSVPLRIADMFMFGSLCHLQASIELEGGSTFGAQNREDRNRVGQRWTFHVADALPKQTERYTRFGSHLMN